MRPQARRTRLRHQIDSRWFVSPLQRSLLHGIATLLGSRAAAYVFLAASVDLFALTPVFLRRVDTSGRSRGVLFAWAVFGAISVILLIFLWFGMWWHWLVIDRHHSAARKPGSLFCSARFGGAALVTTSWCICLRPFLHVSPSSGLNQPNFSRGIHGSRAGETWPGVSVPWCKKQNRLKGRRASKFGPGGNPSFDSCGGIAHHIDAGVLASFTAIVTPPSMLTGCARNRVRQ